MMSRPRSSTPSSAPRIDIGTIMITASGRVRLSYCAASTRKTNRAARMKTPAPPPSVFCRKASSVHS